MIDRELSVIGCKQNHRTAAIPFGDHIQFSPATVPAPPTFSEDMAAVRERAAKLVDKAPIRKTLSNQHPLIAEVLAADEKRKEALAKSPYGFVLDKPLFDTPLEKRRLKILNNLFLALAHCAWVLPFA